MRCKSRPIRSGDWQLNATRFLQIEFRNGKQRIRSLLPEPHPGLICVFLRLGAEYGSDEFFVVRWLVVQAIIAEHYRANLRKHGGARPRNPESTHTIVPREKLEVHRNAWDVFGDVVMS